MANTYPPSKPTPTARLRLAWSILVNPIQVLFNLKKTAVNHNDVESSPVFCLYKNEVKQIQILRVVGENHYCHFEQVIFPTQQLLFTTPPKAQLEVYTGTFISTVLTDKLTCEDLEIKVSERAIA